MKTVRDACQLQPNALSIKLSDQIEQLDEIINGRAMESHSSRKPTSPMVCETLSQKVLHVWLGTPHKLSFTSNKPWAAVKLTSS